MQCSKGPSARGEGLTCRLIVTDDKEGASSVFQKEIHDVRTSFTA